MRAALALLTAAALATAPAPLTATALAQKATLPSPATQPADGARGERPAPRTSLYEIEEQVMCVVCRTPLSVAGGPQADAQRDLIRRLIDEGLTAEQVKAALVAEYGERVLALPEDEGFSVAVYLVPLGVVVAALTLAAIFLPRWRRRARALAAARPTPLGPDLSDDDARRLEEDLRRYDC